MARKYKQQSVVSGLSVGQIFGDDGFDYKYLNNLSLSSLRKITSRGVSALNKRIRRVYKSGLEDYSPSILNLAREQRTPDSQVPSFSIKGITSKRDLLKVFKRMKEFYNTKTSTVKGAKSQKKRLEELFGDKSRDINLLNIYNRAFQRFQDLWNKQEKIPSTQIRDTLSSIIMQYEKSSLSDDAIVDALVETLKKTLIENDYTNSKNGGRTGKAPKGTKLFSIKRK